MPSINQISLAVLKGKQVLKSTLLANSVKRWRKHQPLAQNAFHIIHQYSAFIHLLTLKTLKTIVEE